MRTKVMSVSEAVALIKDNDTVAITAAGLIGYPEYIVKTVEEHYALHGCPKNLTVVAGGSHGVRDNRGDSRFGHPGLLKRYIGTHPNTIPPVRKMIENNETEGYVLPQGIVNQLFRSIGAKQAGVISKIGLGTYMDPRQDGGRINTAAADELIELIELHGEEWLLYKRFPIDVALIRATTADENGNLTIEEEALKLEILEAALAAKAGGGTVIAQVKYVVAADTLKAKQIVVPGRLVDAVVVAENFEENHRQSKAEYYSPYLSGELKAPAAVAAKAKETLEAEDIITRRAVYELFPGAVINLGLGIGVGVGQATAPEGILDKITFTVELGAFGGIPRPMTDFGTCLNPDSFVVPSAMFDFYHGGGLDITFLGAAQVDRKGNVNVSKFENRAAGQGGFIDISQSSKKVVFCLFLRAKDFEADINDGELTIKREGNLAKFVDAVDQITFCGDLAIKAYQEVVYITERAVFKLTSEGLELVEIAPGIDLEKDVLAQMEFKPIIGGNIRIMDERIFKPGRMGCFDS